MPAIGQTCFRDSRAWPMSVLAGRVRSTLLSCAARNCTFI